MAEAAASKEQSEIWWVFLLEGIAAILFGILLITNPAATLVVLVLFLGLYWLFVGVLSLVRIFVDKSVPWYWSLLIGILGVVAGLIVLKHPLFAAVVLPTAIVVWLGVLGLVIGALAVLRGFNGGGWGSFLFGAVNIIIGLLLLGAPMAAAVAVPLVFGILLLVEGVVQCVYAFRLRS